jgi:hypothetical protein
MKSNLDWSIPHNPCMCEDLCSAADIFKNTENERFLYVWEAPKRLINKLLNLENIIIANPNIFSSNFTPLNSTAFVFSL